MGHLIYGVAPAINIDDRTLQHLRSVIVAKLRRDESFIFTRGDEPSTDGAADGQDGGHYGSVWISKAASLYFSFEKQPDGPLNPEWLHLLADMANSIEGLRSSPEPARRLTA